MKQDSSLRYHPPSCGMVVTPGPIDEDHAAGISVRRAEQNHPNVNEIRSIQKYCRPRPVLTATLTARNSFRDLVEVNHMYDEV